VALRTYFFSVLDGKRASQGVHFIDASVLKRTGDRFSPPMFDNPSHYCYEGPVGPASESGHGAIDRIKVKLLPGTNKRRPGGLVFFEQTKDRR